MTSTILPVSPHQLRLVARPGRKNGDPFTVVFHWRGRGEIDPEQIKTAVHRLIERHGALRTTFGTTPTGEFMQVIAASPRDEQFVWIEADDNREVADALVAKMADKCFPLADGPLFEFSLITGPADEFDIVLAVDHVVVDEGSSKVLRRDFLTLMTDSDQLSKPAPLNMQGCAAEDPADVEFWRTQLDRLPPRVFADRHDRSLVGGPHIVSSADLTAEEASLVRRNAREARVSLASYFLSATVLGVRAMSGAEDLAISMPADTRDSEDELETVGYYQNLIPTVVRTEATDSVHEVRVAASAALMEALEHRRLPLWRLMQMFDPSGREGVDPLLEILFSYHLPGCDIWEIPGAELHPVVEDGPTQIVEMNVSVDWRDDGRCNMGVTVDPSLASPEKLASALQAMRASLLMQRPEAEATQARDFLQHPAGA
ncbi:MAG: condensation domain-containing protein [Bifidobacteriaceae bacterium]|nr:condensation domain-containing protein [Bifidobacteriaceae bacterium]